MPGVTTQSTSPMQSSHRLTQSFAGQASIEPNKNALVPGDESAHSRGTTPLGSLCGFVLTMEPA